MIIDTMSVAVAGEAEGARGGEAEPALPRVSSPIAMSKKVAGNVEMVGVSFRPLRSLVRVSLLYPVNCYHSPSLLLGCGVFRAARWRFPMFSGD
ncbi:hypothetical protein GW17_00006222 [Ensete ventricosum]|nr:hypothetical protein GW17_00006222 [Ensete ventricosum]